VAGKRHAPTGIAALAAAACLAAAGCGGGGDDSTTTTTQAATVVPTVTAPAQTPSTTAAGAGQGAGAGSSAQPPAPGNQPGQRPGALLGSLGPFQDCLTRHGVNPVQFRETLRQQYQGGQAGASGGAESRRRIEAGIACIPELPPQFRQQAERLARRYQQQNG
jgi:hypothetical protein